MKHIPLLILLAFSLSLCKLTDKLTDKKTDSSNTSAGSSASTGGGVEHPNPTTAQTQALEGGQSVKWEQQDITWTLPKGWNKMTVESKQFNYGAPGNAAFIIASISPLDENFPTDVSLNAFYDGARTRQKNGEIDELRWLELDGLKGVEFREANPERPDGIRRLQWIAYRKYNGQTQMIDFILSSSGKEFPSQQDALYGILYSTKLAH